MGIIGDLRDRLPPPPRPIERPGPAQILCGVLLAADIVFAGYHAATMPQVHQTERIAPDVSPPALVEPARQRVQPGIGWAALRLPG